MKRTSKALKLISASIALVVAVSMAGCVSEKPAASSAPASAAPASQAPATAAAEKPSEAPAAPSVDKVKVGIIYPLTGTAAKTGKEYVIAYELAAEIINGKFDDLDMPFASTEGLPNLSGAKIEFTVGDHKGEAELGLAEAERLITQEKVDVLMGCHYSAVTKTASNVAERLGVPFLCPDSTSMALTDRGFNWFFRSGPHDGTFVDDTYKFLTELNKNQNANIKKVAIVAEDTEFGALLSQLEEEKAPEYGFEVAEKIVHPANSINLTSEVLKLKASGADAFLMASYTSDAILFLKSFEEQNILPKVILGQRAGYIAPELFEALGKTADYIFTTNVWSLDLSEKNPLISKVNDLYKARSGGVSLTGDYARAFTGMFVMADAINRAGSLDKEAIRKALSETDIKNNGQLIVPWEGIKFNEKNQNIYATGIITQAFDGTYKTVYPTANKAVDPVVPMPAWDKR